jgi:translation initiation factor 3 subunit H
MAVQFVLFFMGDIDPALLETHQIESVELDALAALQISHRRTGNLYGLDLAAVMRVAHVDDSDYLLVGFYRSTFMGSFWNQELLEMMHSHQKTYPQSILIIYDPVKTCNGSESFSAYRLSDQFISIYQSGNFALKDLESFDTFQIFDSLPVTIRSSPICDALLLKSSLGNVPFPYQKADHNIDPLTLDGTTFTRDGYVEKSIEFLTDTLEEHAQEHAKWANWLKAYEREYENDKVHRQRLFDENKDAELAGLEPPYSELQLQDVLPSLLKIASSEPSRLETLLIENQVQTYCHQMRKAVE